MQQSETYADPNRSGAPQSGPPQSGPPQSAPRLLTGRRGEWTVFAVLAVLIWPFVAVGVVGGYGFLVWMFQLIFGPPGPPAG